MCVSVSTQGQDSEPAGTVTMTTQVGPIRMLSTSGKLSVGELQNCIPLNSKSVRYFCLALSHNVVLDYSCPTPLDISPVLNSCSSTLFSGNMQSASQFLKVLLRKATAQVHSANVVVVESTAKTVTTAILQTATEGRVSHCHFCQCIQMYMTTTTG